MLQADPPGFIVYDRWARKYNPRLVSLAEPSASPPWLRAIYTHPSIVVYRVEMERAG